jgi:O-methyltransferase
MIKKILKPLARYISCVNQTEDLLFQVDPVFQKLYAKGTMITGTPKSGEAMVNKRQARFYNLTNLVALTEGLGGDSVEIGCWKGLSAYLINETFSSKIPGYTGKGFWIVDSFEGLSKAVHQDTNLEDFVPSKIQACGGNTAGSFSASLKSVQNALEKFPDIKYVKGWVPECLKEIPKENRWKFVHIDLDLYDPIRGAFEFFSTKMVSGGVIVFDDYGSLYWPGARKAVHEIAIKSNGRLVALSTGQAFWQAY